jgi:hypothetical protein
MEEPMQSVTEPAVAPTVRPQHWVVELNIGGCQIRRWAQKRRHLLGLRPQIGNVHLALLKARCDGAQSCKVHGSIREGVGRVKIGVIKIYTPASATVNQIE